MALTKKPEVIEKHRAEPCGQCYQKLGEELVAQKVEKQQVLDLPPLRYITTEHQVETVVCPFCGTENRGDFPEGVTSQCKMGRG